MSRSKRVAVTSPQTRLARSRRQERGRWRMPRLRTPEAERATELYRSQRRRGIPALVAMFALVLGLPVVFSLAPGLDAVRMWGIPVSWLVIAVLPYPVLAALAWWQLRRAEKTEDDQ
ncbi:membrane protein [Amycolatopsis benzoatilytica]|uniref:membrane protein n=1 Tax=Amycolatopsis benzoatilytica TaxID=346045 RepID=UPI0003A0998B|nr:membrane protein [Amycolatopsis benzoatilytica]